MAKPKHIYLISAARKVWYWSQERKAAIKTAMVGPDLVQCATCQKKIPIKAKHNKRSLFAVDHVEPVVPPDKLFPSLEPNPPTDSLSWDEYLQRLMYGALQVLCLPCHSAKSKTENQIRRKNTNERRKKPNDVRILLKRARK